MGKHFSFYTSARTSLLLLLLFSGVQACPPFTLLNTFTTQGSLLETDQFRNFYVASDNRVFKFNDKGEKLNSYEEFRYGKIGNVDLTNPLKLLIYYPDFMTAVITDKFLAPISTFRFFDLGYQNIACAASSADGRMWIYDNAERKVKKLDENGRVIYAGQSLEMILEQAPNPNYIIEHENNLYVNDPAIGILMFDLFGNYARTVPLKGLMRFQVERGQIVYFQEGALRSYNLLTLEIRQLEIPEPAGAKWAVLQKERMAIMREKQVDFYAY